MILAKGHAIKENFVLIKENPNPTALPSLSVATSECCVFLNVLAETSYTNDLYNDKTDFTKFFNNGFASAVIVLEKYTTAWNTVATLNNNTYGTFSAFGFYDTIYTEKAIGFLLDWRLVKAAFGEGVYRMKCTGTTLLSTTVDKYSFEFNLLTYTQDRADNTVRVEAWLNGNIGDPEDDTKKRDFGTINRYTQFRIPGAKFGFDEANVERKFIKYQTGKKIWTEDLEWDTYTLRTNLLSYEVRRFIKYDLMKGSEIRITDYNTVNSSEHINRYVIPNGTIKTNYNDFIKNASLEIKFDQYYQNNEKKRC